MVVNRFLLWIVSPIAWFKHQRSKLLAWLDSDPTYTMTHKQALEIQRAKKEPRWLILIPLMVVVGLAIYMFGFRLFDLRAH